MRTPFFEFNKGSILSEKESFFCGCEMGIPVRIEQLVTKETDGSYNFLGDNISRLDDEAVCKIIEFLKLNNHQLFLNVLCNQGNGLPLVERTTNENLPLIPASERHSEQLAVFFDVFSKWEPYREELIATALSSADELDKNNSRAIIMRLVGSSVEMVSSFSGMIFNQFGFLYFSKFAVATASCFGFLGLFFTASEVVRSKHVHKKLIRAIEMDREMFEDVRKRFKEMEKRKSALKVFFPYGIDENFVQKIRESSFEADDCLKKFLSDLLSNIPKKTELSMDAHLSENSQFFSCSEEAKQWWKRIILEQHPLYVEGMKAFLKSDIPAIKELECCAESLLPMDAVKFIATNTQMKLLLCGLSIYTAINDLVHWTKSKASVLLWSFGKKKEKELQAMKTVVEHLKDKNT